MSPRLLVLALLASAACQPICQTDSDCAAGDVCQSGICVAGGGGPIAQGNLTLSPGTASVQSVAGQPTPGTSFTLGNDGGAGLTFAVSCTPGAPSPSGGQLAAGASISVAVALPVYTTAGQESAICTATTSDGTGGPQAFTVAVQVVVGAPALTAPAAGATVSGSVQLAASASVSTVALDFALDGAVIATAGGSFSAWWDTTAAANGPHALTAIAHDGAGDSATSPGVAVTVGNYPGAAISVHTRMGLLDEATADVANPDHFLSVKRQYVVSYDAARRVPNWVSWELNSAWMGTAARQNDFRPDDTFPQLISQAQLADYVGSGFDRGHMCPSEDRTDTVADNQNTFYLTNMVPQADNVNGGPWAQLEAYSRTLATQGHELFIVSGGIYAGALQTIGSDAVAVPSSTFKLIVVLDGAAEGAADVTASTRAIAVVMPNDASVAKSADWHGFRVAPSAIEAQTGLKLLADVSWPARQVLESEVDTAP